MTAADLTTADRQLLEQLLAGKKPREIAIATGVAASTIGYRVMALKNRIDVRTLVQLGAWAERHGIREAGAG